MTGQELKAFALKVSDESIIEVREHGYGDYAAKFCIRAVIESSGHIPENVE